MIFYADVKKSKLKVDAIKFLDIKFDFRTKNESLQQELDNVLESFRISPTHFGNSCYRYEDKIYFISTNQYFIWYSTSGHVLSDSLLNIQHGDPILSPFGLWKVELSEFGYNNFTFNELSKCRNEIDLELAGTARFMERNKISSSELHLNKYYKTIEENIDSKNTSDHTDDKE